MSDVLFTSLPSRLTAARVALVAGIAVAAATGVYVSGAFRDTSEIGVAAAGQPAAGSPDAPAPADGATSTTEDEGPLGGQEGARRIEAADAGHLMVGVVDGSLWLDAVVPADGWEETVVTTESPLAIEVAFTRGDEQVDVTVEQVEQGDGWLVTVHDRRTGEEQSGDLNDYSPPTTFTPGDGDGGDSSSSSSSPSTSSPSTSSPSTSSPSTSSPPTTEEDQVSTTSSSPSTSSPSTTE